MNGFIKWARSMAEDKLSQAESEQCPERRQACLRAARAWMVFAFGAEDRLIAKVVKT